MSELVNIAEAVTKAINEATLSQEATAILHDIDSQDSFADWDIVLEDLDVLHIDVVPTADETALAGRGNTRHRCSVDVGVRKKFDAKDQDPQTGRIKRERIKELISLYEEIVEIFTGKRMEYYEPAHWVATLNRNPYSRQHLRENRQYTGIATLTFSSYKQKPEL